MDLSALQSRLGYQFNNPDLLTESLTHPSYLLKNHESKSNQRLEFLGDAVLELIISEHLYSVFPDNREGRLTQYRSNLVKGSTLDQLALELNIAEALLVNDIQPIESPKNLPSSREDALEAIIGAIYMDSDFKTVRSVVLNWYGDIHQRIERSKPKHNPKGQLQELLQPDISNERIEYRVKHETGPSHDPRFEVELFINDRLSGRGRGKSKKEAEELAALVALKNLDEIKQCDA